MEKPNFSAVNRKQKNEGDALENLPGRKHFQMFNLEPYKVGKPLKTPYSRRDFYKVMLVKG